MVTNRSSRAASNWAGGWARIQAGMAVSAMPGRSRLTVTLVPASSAASGEDVLGRPEQA